MVILLIVVIVFLRLRNEAMRNFTSIGESEIKGKGRNDMSNVEFRLG